MDLDAPSYNLYPLEFKKLLPVPANTSLAALADIDLPRPIAYILGSKPGEITFSTDPPDIVTQQELARCSLPLEADVNAISLARLERAHRDGYRSIVLGFFRAPLGIVRVWKEIFRIREMQKEVRQLRQWLEELDANDKWGSLPREALDTLQQLPRAGHLQVGGTYALIGDILAILGEYRCFFLDFSSHSYDYRQEWRSLGE